MTDVLFINFYKVYDRLGGLIFGLKFTLSNVTSFIPDKMSRLKNIYSGLHLNARPEITFEIL